MTKTFEKKFRPVFIEKLTKINKKLSKYGKEITIISESEKTIVPECNTPRNCIDDRDIDRIQVRVMVTVELSGPEILHNGRNVKHIGTISFKDGVKQIFNATENDTVLGSIPDSELHCDHCHINRYRVKYFFFEEDSKILQIGSSCCIDYFGMDIERYLDVWTAAMGDLDSISGGGGRAIDHIYDVLMATYLATNGFKGFWVSKEKAEEQARSSTSENIRLYLNPPRGNNRFANEIRDDISEAYTLLTPKFDSMLTEVKAKWCIQPKNDFEYNVYNNLFYGNTDDSCDLREYIVSPGIVGFAIYKTFAAFIPSDRKPSEFVGTIDEKYLTIVKVRDIKEVESMYGTTSLVIFEEESGNELKTFTTSSIKWEIGQTYKIKGTVKSHDTYHNFKSTLLKRVTLQK